MNVPIRFLPIVGLLMLSACGASDPYPEDQIIVLCYRTLADVQCYDKPDEHRDSRLVGFYLLPDGDIADSGTALEWARKRAAEEAAGRE